MLASWTGGLAFGPRAMIPLLKALAAAAPMQRAAPGGLHKEPRGGARRAAPPGGLPAAGSCRRRWGRAPPATGAGAAAAAQAVVRPAPPPAAPMRSPVACRPPASRTRPAPLTWRGSTACRRHARNGVRQLPPSLDRAGPAQACARVLHARACPVNQGPAQSPGLHTTPCRHVCHRRLAGRNAGADAGGRGGAARAPAPPPQRRRQRQRQWQRRQPVGGRGGDF